ncbi:glycosyltransferase family 2 protein [Candidatus Latescibacterota bacterium]
MDLSVVATMYSSEAHIWEFCKRISAAAAKITDDYELIIVNDGSPDKSLDITLSFFEQNDNVKIIDLSRNFGHYKAIMTGLSHASGDLVFLIDSDLEEEPELLESFHHEYISDKSVDVVYGIQKTRKGAMFEKISGAFFYKFFNFFSVWKIPMNVSTVRLMSKSYVENLIKHEDSEVFLAGLWVMTGFKQKPLVFTKHNISDTTYSLRKKMAVVVNAITSFSVLPLLYVFYMGTVISAISTFYIIAMIYKKLVLNIPVPGYTSLIVSIFFLGGLTIFSIGIIGIYLSKIFMEVKRWPYTIIKTIHEHNHKD